MVDKFRSKEELQAMSDIDLIKKYPNTVDKTMPHGAKVARIEKWQEDNSDHFKK